MRKCYLLISLLVLYYSTDAQGGTAIDSFFCEKVEGKQLAGAVTLVAREGKILHFNSYGYMDVEQSIPMES